MLLDRTEQAEVSSFNDLLKTLHNFYKAEEPDSEDKLIKEMENFEEMFGDTEIKFEQDSNKKLSETFAGDLKSLIKG
ncbi:hypothetical protein H8D85_02535 [bacterium]|nr:hypothetical protein [bacterium]